MHVFAKYLKNKGIRQYTAVQALGISHKHMSEILNYKSGVSPELAIKMRDYTNGEVTTDQILDECAQVENANV